MAGVARRAAAGDPAGTRRDFTGRRRQGPGLPQYLSEVERGGKEASSEILAAIGSALDTTLLDLTTGVAERLQDAAATARPAASNVVRLAA